MKNSNKKIPDAMEIYENLNQTALRQLKKEGMANTAYFKIKLDMWSDESLLELASLIVERVDKGGA